MLADTENLMLEQHGPLLTVWLNRPQVRNALSAEMVDELIATFGALPDRRDIRIVILRGRGGVFCAGGDLKLFGKVFQGGASRDQIAGFNASLGPLVEAIRNTPQLFLVLIEGAAMAGGLGISCLADVVVTTRDARFALSEVTLGLPPAQIAPLVIRRVGLSEAQRLMLTAQQFDGTEAARLGFAHFVVADAEALECKADQLVKEGLRGAPGAIAKTKQIIAAAERLQGDELVQFAAYGFADCLLSDEAREGLAAFMEKRQPAWVGGQGAAGESS